MPMSLRPVVASRRSHLKNHLGILASLALALGMGSTGCFRATGISRPDVAVEEIPASGGDRVLGLKATAGPGDFFLGNDSVQMAVDGAAFGDRAGQFGARSGGAVLDVGTITLDQSFHRVSVPTDMLERLGPVANQDPDLPLAFDRFTPSTNGGGVQLHMQGYLLDPGHKLTGVTWDAQDRVSGVTASHLISLNRADGFFTLETTLTPASGTTLPVLNLGDYLSQHGGGYRIVVPAVAASGGTALPAPWGVDIPGSDFTATTPLRAVQTSVRAPMVGFMGAESAGSTFDYHASLGIMPLDLPADSDYVLVASDPQAGLKENRPIFPARVVVGSPVTSGLVNGQSITYRRRLYVVGGPSNSSLLPAQTTTVFNLMAQARAGFRGENVGSLAYNTFGTAVRGGPLQTEFRFERYQFVDPDPKNPLPFDPTDPTNPASQPQNWFLERVEWREPGEVSSSNGAEGMLLPALPDLSHPLLSQRYRITARNAGPSSSTLYQGTNLLDTTRPNLSTPITPSSTQAWLVAQTLSPERDDTVKPVLDSLGNVVASRQTVHVFSARQVGTLEFGGLNPLRITFTGNGATLAPPNVQRFRKLSSSYSQIYKAKTPVSLSFGAYQYTAGNQVFGTAFGAQASPAVMYFPAGDYLAYATRGPLSQLESLPFSAFDGQTDTNHGFIVTPPSLPPGWTSFDLPSPTQATTGGYNPGEMLSSAVAEGVQVVARTEQDLLTDPVALQAEFRAEIDIAQVSDAQRAPLGNDPFVVGARTSDLTATKFGVATTLFTSAPTTDRNGGARPSTGWTLADFMTQAQGSYTVVHRPYGPSGLFTLQQFAPTVPLGQGVNAWWNQTGPVALGLQHGQFDAVELLRAQSWNPNELDPAAPSGWYAEFTKVRESWYAILNQQTPAFFTKGLGLSAAQYSLDTPVGLARTYLNLGTTTPLAQADLSMVLAALRSGAAVASTGPMLDVSVGGVGPGGLVKGSSTSVLTNVTVAINLYAPDWVPVDEVRVVVNGILTSVQVNGAGTPVQVIPVSAFTYSASDKRLRTVSVTVPLPAGKDAWLVVEAGVPRAQSGSYLPGSTWSKIMRGIYPIALTNPIFVDVAGDGYTRPGL